MSSFCIFFSKQKKTIFIVLMYLFLKPIIAFADGIAVPPPPDEPVEESSTTTSSDSTQDEITFVEVFTILLNTIL